MKGTKLLLLPFVIGVILMVYSWYLSYPLTIDTADDFVFNHMSVLYWFSLAILLTSMYMIAITSKSNFSKWMISVGIVITIYSTSYFYSMVPGADSQLFRGMTEYYVKTKNLDPLLPNHAYYQWPSFFVLADTATSVSGIELANFEFLLYTLIGFLLATTFYVYAFKAYKNSAYLAVTAFFISTIYFLNFQPAPFSLALGLLFLLFMLETRQHSPGSILTIIVLFTAISITHAFVPLFFVLYLLIRSIFNRSRQYINLGIATLIIYFIVQFTQAQFSFAQNIIGALTWGSEYSFIVEKTLKPVSVPVDVTAQMLSRTVTIAFVMICIAGFVLLLIKRKMRNLDKAILLAGTFYSGVGVYLGTLGQRAIPIAFIPISLGAAYLFESRFRRYLKYLFLVLLILSIFIVIHQSFNNDIQFQTQEAYRAEHFMIDNYNWTKTNLILANYRVITYFQSELSVNPYFSANPQMVKEANTIFYTVGLAKDFSGENYTMERLFQDERFNTLYNNGFSYLAVEAQP